MSSGGVAPGKIVELGERVFIVDTLHRELDGTLAAITALCLNPQPGDDDQEWWALEVTDEDLLVAHTIQ